MPYAPVYRGNQERSDTQRGLVIASLFLLTGTLHDLQILDKKKKTCAMGSKIFLFKKVTEKGDFHV